MLKYFILFIFLLRYAHSISPNSILIIITNNSNKKLTYSVKSDHLFALGRMRQINISLSDYGISTKFDQAVIKDNIKTYFNSNTLRQLTLGQIYSFGPYKFTIPPQSKLTLLGTTDRSINGDNGGSGADFLNAGFDTIRISFSLLPVASYIEISREAGKGWNIKTDSTRTIDFDDARDSSANLAILNLNIDKNNNLGYFTLDHISSNVAGISSDGIKNIQIAPYDSIIQNPPADKVDSQPFRCINPSTENQKPWHGH